VRGQVTNPQLTLITASSTALRAVSSIVSPSSSARPYVLM